MSSVDLQDNYAWYKNEMQADRKDNVSAAPRVAASTGTYARLSYRREKLPYAAEDSVANGEGYGRGEDVQAGNKNKIKSGPNVVGGGADVVGDERGNKRKKVTNVKEWSTDDEQEPVDNVRCKKKIETRKSETQFRNEDKRRKPSQSSSEEDQPPAKYQNDREYNNKKYPTGKATEDDYVVSTKKNVEVKYVSYKNCVEEFSGYSEPDRPMKKTKLVKRPQHVDEGNFSSSEDESTAMHENDRQFKGLSSSRKVTKDMNVSLVQALPANNIGSNNIRPELNMPVASGSGGGGGAKGKLEEDPLLDVTNMDMATCQKQLEQLTRKRKYSSIMAYKYERIRDSCVVNIAALMARLVYLSVDNKQSKK